MLEVGRVSLLTHTARCYTSKCQGIFVWMEMRVLWVRFGMGTNVCACAAVYFLCKNC